jgi:hypothetical protein
MGVRPFIYMGKELHHAEWGGPCAVGGEDGHQTDARSLESIRV